MSNNVISKVGYFVNENKKPLLYIGGAIAVIVIGYAIISKVTKGVKGVFTDKSTGATSFSELPIDESKVTISNQVANTYANQLFGAMTTPGTDSSLIYSIMNKLQKKDDFLKVYNAFGRKSYNGIVLGGSPNVADKALGNYEDLDLIEWFNEELSWLNPSTYSLVKKTVTNAGLAF